MLVRTASEIGAFIRDRRKRLGLDQRTLAARAGVSRQWLIEVERGKPRAELGLVLRTLDALGVRLLLEMSAERLTADNLPESPDIDAIIERHRSRRSS